MHLLFDADGLIKLHRAGVLSNGVSTFPTTVPEAAHEEVVTQGKANLYEDAEEIERSLADAADVLPAEEVEPEPGLGRGEMAVLNRALRQPDAVVVSDDRRFLSLLTDRDVGFLTPADLVVVLARRDVITKIVARDALDRLRPVIRPAAYWEAKEDLREGTGNEE